MKKSVFIFVLLLLLSGPAFAALKINDPAPGFSLPELGKTRFSFSAVQSKDRRGGGLIISFFASWCRPCRTELPILNALVEELGASGITVVLVGVREDFPAIRAFLQDINVDKPVVLSDRDGSVAEQYRVLFLPTTFFVAPDGRVKYIIFGQIRDEAQVRKCAASITR